MKITFKRTAKGVTVQFADLTQGGALSLCNALQEHAAAGSAVCNDLRQILRNRIQEAGTTSNDQQLFEALAENAQ